MRGRGCGVDDLSLTSEDAHEGKMIPVLSTHIEPSVLGSDASDHQRAVGIQTHPGGLGQLLDHLPQAHHCGVMAGCLKVPGCARAGGGGGG